MPFSVRIRGPSGQQRLDLTSPAVGPFLKQGSALFGLSLQEFGRGLYLDPQCSKRLLPGRISSRASLQDYGVAHGGIVYLKPELCDPTYGQDVESSDGSEDTQLKGLSAENIKSLADIPPPPRIGEKCSHPPTVRCQRCFEEWQNAVLRYIGKTREELEFAEAEGSGGVETARKFTDIAGVGKNVLDLNAVRKAFSLNQQVVRYQDSTFVRLLSISSGVTSFMRRLFESTEYSLGFVMMLYGQVQYPDPNDAQSAVLTAEWAFLPMQVTLAGVVMLKTDPEAQQKNAAGEFVARKFGLVPVGEVICRRKEREFIFSANELGTAVQRAVALPSSPAHGNMRHYCLVDCCIDKTARTIELSPYTPSQQLLNLTKAGMLLPPQRTDPANMLRFKEKQLVEKTMSELVETTLFLKPVALSQHAEASTTLACGIASWDFPPYNGVADPTIVDLRDYMKETHSKPVWERFADPNLLVYLTDLFSNDELAEIIDGVIHRKSAAAFANALDLIANTIACIDA